MDDGGTMSQYQNLCMVEKSIFELVVLLSECMLHCVCTLYDCRTPDFTPCLFRGCSWEKEVLFHKFLLPGLEAFQMKDQKILESKCFLQWVWQHRWIYSITACGMCQDALSR